ncbi:aminoglycoside phosphotransferase family protein [Nonomuraea sp. NPDC050310]|uniref:aminoglycoside phosphotransferase family protein n=1 Tax=Nonomuraea sp. NPDC050310 TaxID=3154935 RepID=UPI0033D8BEE6
MSDNPPASGVRVPWEQVPARVRAEVERVLGAPVAEAVTQTGGFSPAAAVRIRLADGSRAFVKAIGPEPNPDSVEIYRAEARVAAMLPAETPMPRMLHTFELDGWVTLVFEDVDGRHPALPWRADELERVRDVLEELGKITAPAGLPTVAAEYGGKFRGWRLLQGEDLTGLDPWALANLDRLAELESGWAEAAAGGTLIHADTRADNVLLTDDRVYLVDWPYACVGAAWFDWLCMLPSVRMQGGPPPQDLLPDPSLPVVSALAGYLVRQSRLPAPPGLPTVRSFQRAQGAVTLDWLKHCLHGQ